MEHNLIFIRRKLSRQSSLRVLLTYMCVLTPQLGLTLSLLTWSMASWRFLSNSRLQSVNPLLVFPKLLGPEDVMVSRPTFRIFILASAGISSSSSLSSSLNTAAADSLGLVLTMAARGLHKDGLGKPPSFSFIPLDPSFIGRGDGFIGLGVICAGLGPREENIPGIMEGGAPNGGGGCRGGGLPRGAGCRGGGLPRGGGGGGVLRGGGGRGGGIPGGGGGGGMPRGRGGGLTCSDLSPS